MRGTPRIVGGGSSGGTPISTLTGTPQEVVYIDNFGNGTGDSNFVRNSSNYITYMLMPQNAGVDVAGIAIGNDLLGVPGTNGILMRRGDDAEVVGSTIMGIIDGTPLGAPSAYIGFLRADDAVTGESFQQFFFPGTGGMSASDGTDSGLMQLGVGQAQFGADNNDGGGNDTAGFTADVNGGGGSQYARMFATQSGPGDYGIEVTTDRVTVDFGAFTRNPGSFFDLTSVPSMDGQVLTGYVDGSTAWTIPSVTASLTAKQIGFGSVTDQLTGTDFFQYYEPDYRFEQVIPNNTGNSGVYTSPLAFGPASFTGSGLDDLTLTWDSATYKSNKYGGNLTIQIDSTGTPDTFSWHYTGGYSQVIGSGTGIPITGGPQVLSDLQGRRIGDITFGSTTGHTNGDTWSAGTSLSTYSWGQKVSDGSHTFIFTQPVYGQYYIGDGQYLTDLGGNGTRIETYDQLGEFSIYSPRYFRVEAPGGNTVALADMLSTTWHQYGTFRIVDTATSSIWFDTKTASAITRIGDVQSVNNQTLFTVNDTSRVITGRAEDAFGGSYTFGTNGVSQFAELTSNDGAGYTGLVRATATTSYIQSQSGTNSNAWQTTATAALGTATDGTDSVTLNLTPTNATITGLTNSSQLALDDTNTKLTFSTGGTDRFIAYKDWIFLGGAVVFGSIQSYTSTGNVTINNNVSVLQYDPASVNATATITLPATSGGSGSRVTIVFGGTVTSGNPVVTALTIAPNTGNTIVDSNPPTTANAGDVLEYIKIGAYWYRAD